jgi:hypothetical protein
MADSFKKKVLNEINRIADNPVYPENERIIADWLGNRIADLEDAETKRALYALMTKDSRIRNLMKYLPEEGSEIRDFVLSEQKPVYTSPDRNKIGEMFASVGGEEVLDQMSPKFFGVNKEVDRAKVRAVAKANGMTEQELWKAMQEESTKMEREKIASGERETSLGGMLGTKALGVFMPRGIERVKRGEDLKPKDVALDIGENVAYTLNPVQAGARVVGTRALGKIAPKTLEVLERGAENGLGGYTKRVIGAVGSSATNPLLMEGADVVAYNVGDEESEDFERKKFSPYDVAVGTSVNLGMPMVLRGITMRGGRAGSYTMKRDNVLEDIGKGNTIEEFISDITKRRQARKIAKENAYARMRETSTELHPKSSMTPEEMRVYSSFKPASENEKFDNVVFEIAKIKGANPNMTLDEATQAYLNRGNGMSAQEGKEFFKQNLDGRYFTITNGGEIHPKDDLIGLIEKSDYAPLIKTKFTTELKRNVPADVLSLASNKMGDVSEQRERRKIANSFMPEFLQKEIDLEEKRKKEDAERRAQERFLLGLE